MNILQYLLSLGAPIGRKSLFFAAEMGKFEVLRLLVQHDDDVDENGIDMWDPVMIGAVEAYFRRNFVG